MICEADMCYWHVPTPLSWSDALADCENNNGTLFIGDSEASVEILDRFEDMGVLTWVKVK